MKAMILAAGLGTRLRPLTAERPKALVPVGNQPVVDRVIEYLRRHGFTEIVVNAHHHRQQMLSHLGQDRAGLSIRVSVEPEILGTGGGIKNMEPFWGPEPFVVINSDVLTDIDLTRAYEEHNRWGAKATLILLDREPFNQVVMNPTGHIVRISSLPTPSGLAFTGIHIISPELLRHIPADTYSDIIDCYRRLIREDTPPRGYRVEGCYWRDIGTVESYMAANRETVGNQGRLLGPGCQIAGSARIEGWAVIGEDSVVGEKAKIRRSVLWDRVRIHRGITVEDSIITSSKAVGSDLLGKVV
jgi:NDP-sugar pyrophosphorylase family protein